MSFILYEEKEQIAKIIFNNPNQLNAMIPEMGEELQVFIQKINGNREIRCVIFSGQGKAFSSGGNLDFISSHSQKDFKTNKREMIDFYSNFLSIKNIEVPTLAMINGHAIGAGFCIAMACDLRVASDNAKLGVNFAKIGLSSGMGCLYHLVQLAGLTMATELLFTGKIFSSQEAMELKLINKVFSAKELESKTMELANEISKNAPLALKIIKKGLQKVHNSSLQELFDYESEGQAKTFASKDLLEGVQALKEKRLPHFTGE